MSDDDWRSAVSALKTTQAIQEWRQAKTEADMLEIKQKVNEMHAILLQAKGVRWLVVTVAGLVGLGTSLVAHLWK